MCVSDLVMSLFMVTLYNLIDILVLKMCDLPKIVVIKVLSFQIGWHSSDMDSRLFKMDRRLCLACCYVSVCVFCHALNVLFVLSVSCIMS